MEQMPQQGAESQQDSGGATQLVADIQMKMSKLSDLLNGSQAVTPQDKQAYSQILGAFESFVTDNLGQQAGQGPAPAPQAPMPNPIPMHAKA